MRALTSRIRHIHGLKLGGSIGGLVALQLIFAFAVQIIVLRVIGAGRDTDAFIGAQTIPLLTASIVGTALQSIWQPRLAVADAEHASAELERALAMAGAVVLPVTLLLVLLSSPFIHALFAGFPPSQAHLTVTLTRISLIGMFFNILALILAAAGRAAGRFIAVEAVPALSGLVSLAGIAVFLPSTGVEGATWILALRGVAGFAILWFMLGRPWPRDPRDERFATTSRGIFALMGGSSFYKLGPLVDRYWGSLAPAGQLTLYNLAQSGMGAAATLLERAIALPIIPQLSRSIHESDYASTRRICRSTIIKIWLVVIAIGAAGVVAASLMISLLSSLLRITSQQVIFLELLGLALLGFLGVAAAGAAINSAFYSMGDVKTPISVGTLGFFLGLAIKSIAFLNGGLIAMAIATSLYYIITMIIMVVFLERKLNEHASIQRHNGR